jgi:hypothetical protein
MTERGTVPFGATKDTYAWLAKLPASLRPVMRARHYCPSGFGQKIVSFEVGNPVLASEMYAGRFKFGGKSFSASPGEVFSKMETKLEWLAHFNASNRGLHDQYSMRLLHYWSTSKRSKSDIATQIQILLALATDGQMIARRCEASVQESFFDIVGCVLKSLVQLRGRNAEQCTTKAIALLYCLHSFQGLGHLRDMAYELIERNLHQLILPDGGHVSRNTTALVNFLRHTVPLKQVNSQVMPPLLLRSIENGLALLKLKQCPDGTLSGLIGEVEDTDLLRRLLGAQNIEIPKLNFAPQSCFARIEHDKATVIADTSTKLGLDFSDGKQRLIKTEFCELDIAKPAMMQVVPQGTVLMMENAVQKRICFLSTDGQDLRIEDDFSKGDIIIQVAAGIKLSSLLEGQAVMLVLPNQTVWHLKLRGGFLDIRQSNSQSEIIIHSKQLGPINWSLKKQARAVKISRKKQSFESELLI